MELRHTPRLFVTNALETGQPVEVETEQAHYLQHVLRIKLGDPVRLFNGKQGEWKATISLLEKRTVTLTVQEQTRKPEPQPALWICAAPIKKSAL